MSILARIFGAEKAIEKGIDTIDKTIGHAAAGIDALFFTDEEKSAQSVKVMELRMAMVKSLQGENSARSITRRILAIIIVGSTFLHLNLLALFILIGTFWPKLVEVAPGQPKVSAYNWGMENILEVVKIEFQISMLVVFFYFGYYGVKSVIGSVKDKNGGA